RSGAGARADADGDPRRAARDVRARRNGHVADTLRRHPYAGPHPGPLSRSRDDGCWAPRPDASRACAAARHARGKARGADDLAALRAEAGLMPRGTPGRRACRPAQAATASAAQAKGATVVAVPRRTVMKAPRGTACQ